MPQFKVLQVHSHTPGTILAVVMLVCMPLLLRAQSDHVAPVPLMPESLQWQAGSELTPGAESAWFLGSPTGSGLYVQRVRLQMDGRIAPHTHPDERVSIVLEGSIFVGFGEHFDPEETVEIPAGAMYVAPAGIPHYVWAKSGPALYQESGRGPTAATFLP